MNHFVGDLKKINDIGKAINKSLETINYKVKGIKKLEKCQSENMSDHKQHQEKEIEQKEFKVAEKVEEACESIEGEEEDQ